MTTDATRRRALNLRLDADTIHRLKQAALDRGTTASATVERLVEDHLDDDDGEVSFVEVPEDEVGENGRGEGD